MLRMALHWQILIALVLAVIVGSINGAEGPLLPSFDFIGQLFLNALKMLIVPLIVSSLIHGLLGLKDRGALSRLGTKTALYYVATSTFAILTGLLVVNAIAPGIIDGQPAGQTLGLDADTGAVVERVEGRGGSDLWAVLLRMVPTNVFASAAAGEMLGLIFFSLLYGIFAGRLGGDVAASQRRFWEGVYEVMLHITHWVMRFAPLGVFALVAETVASTGWAAIQPLLLFFVCVLLALALHMFVNLSLILRVVAGVNPWRQLQAMSPAILTAFSTSSSSATLPVTMDAVQSRAGVSQQTSGFVLPLGATINMDGTALYECVAAMFIAQAYGLDLSFSVQFVVVWMALVTSIGVAGIPSASLVAIAVILGAIGLPLEGLGLILAVDRVLDMCRTAVNVYSDSCGAVTVARLEGEQGVLAERTPPVAG